MQECISLLKKQKKKKKKKEKKKETVLNFLKGTLKVLLFYFVLIKY